MPETINKKYKDRLFRFIFGSEEHKDWTLALYNAVSNEKCDDPQLIHFNTMQNVVYLKMKNDISFTLKDELILWEHQSTYNPNMPYRFLAYVFGIFAGIVDADNNSQIWYIQIGLPSPKFIVFYNGTDKDFDVETMKLSAAFPEKAEQNMELIVDVYNINAGKNPELLSKVQPLREYSWLVQRIRDHEKEGLKLETAVRWSLEEMPEEFVIKPFLMKEKASVMEMLWIEHDEKRELEKVGRGSYLQGKIDGKTEGKTEGKIEGKIEGKTEEKETIALTMLSKGFSPNVIRECCSMSDEQFAALRESSEMDVSRNHRE